MTDELTNREMTSSSQFILSLTSSAYFRWTAGCIFCLAGVSALASVAYSLTDNWYLKEALERLMHNSEASLPTAFNFLLILFNSIGSLMIFLTLRRDVGVLKYYWILLSSILFLLSYDEVTALHERLVLPLREVVGPNPLLHYPWTPLGMGFFMIFGVVFLPFLLKMQRSVSRMMMLSGVVYVFGAIGMETLLGAFDFYNGVNWIYHLLAIIEESFEMFGMTIFGYALLSYVEKGSAQIGLVVGIRRSPAEIPGIE